MSSLFLDTGCRSESKDDCIPATPAHHAFSEPQGAECITLGTTFFDARDAAAQLDIWKRLPLSDVQRAAVLKELEDAELLKSVQMPRLEREQIVMTSSDFDDDSKEPGQPLPETQQQ